ncbi:MAG: HU family DNA-binding protein [Bacteroides sp.]
MSKEVAFSVVPRKNLLKKDEPAKFYAQAQASGDVDIKEMSVRIEKTCTVTRADVAAVLLSLEDTIVDGLERGEIVRMGEIGTFQIGINGKGAVKEEDYNTSFIKRAKVNFRPGKALTGILPGLTFARVSKKLLAKKPASGGGSTGGGGGETPFS